MSLTGKAGDGFANASRVLEVMNDGPQLALLSTGRSGCHRLADSSSTSASLSLDDDDEDGSRRQESQDEEEKAGRTEQTERGDRIDASSSSSPAAAAAASHLEEWLRSAVRVASYFHSNRH